MSTILPRKSQLLPALHYLAPLEGESSNLQSDRGGATKWGISLRFLNLVVEGDVNKDGHVDEHDVWAMDEEDKVFFYQKYFFDHYRIYEIENQAVANRVMSIFVNFRGHDAALIVQRACKANLKTLVDDGVMGSKTLACMNSVQPTELLAAMRSEQAAMYYRVAAKYPDQAVNLKGWLKRAYYY